MSPEIKFSYYQARPGVQSDYSRRTPDQLIRDVNVLHDFTRNLVREKDQLKSDLGKAERKLDFAKFQIWILGFFVLAEGAMLGWLVNAFLGRLK